MNTSVTNFERDTILLRIMFEKPLPNRQQRLRALNSSFSCLHSLCDAVGGQHPSRKPRRDAGRLSTTPDTNIYIISEETSVFAPQRIPLYKALGVAACTVGKVRSSTVFMCVCSTFRSSDFFTIRKKRIRRGGALPR